MPNHDINVVSLTDSLINSHFFFLIALFNLFGISMRQRIRFINDLLLPDQGNRFNRRCKNIVGRSK